MTLFARYAKGDRVGVGRTKEPGTIDAVDERPDRFIYHVAMDAGYGFTGGDKLLTSLAPENDPTELQEGT
jgi:hypothetical protein